MDISSTQNPRIKQVVKLQQSARERKALDLFVVEGVRECSIALQSGFIPHGVYICRDLFLQDPRYPIDLQKFSQTDLFYVSPDVYAKIAYRSGVEGVVIVFKSRFQELNELSIGKNSLVLVLEKVEKPGNLGAIFRTADAAGVSAVIICDPACDPYNPNAIRASVGCIFGVPWAVTSSTKAIEWLRANNISIISSTPDTTTNYSEVDLRGSCAIVMGAEDTGLSPLWLSGSDNLVRIPMHGKIDSLNVSVSAAILLFESQRQRLTK